MTTAYILRQLHVSIPHIKLNYTQGHENNLGIYSSQNLLSFMLTYIEFFSLPMSFTL